MIEPVRLHHTEDHLLHSEHVGEDFHLWIGRPVAGLDEARLYVEERFDVGGGATLFGSSMGGLFAVWSALTEPGAFAHTIAVSPSLWWDGGVVLDLEAKLAEERDDLAGGLFLGVGGLEEPDHLPFVSRFKLISNVRILAERLRSRGYPSLEVRSEVLDGETHTSVVPVGMTRGLRALLHGTPPAMPDGAPTEAPR